MEGVLPIGEILRLAFEVGVVVLLGIASVLAWRVDRRLAALKSGSTGLSAAVGELAEATLKAQATLAQLRAQTPAAGSQSDGARSDGPRSDAMAHGGHVYGSARGRFSLYSERS